MKMLPSILLRSGNYFDYLEPEKNNYTLEDIAHGLSNVCRFAGHTKVFYSVAQHSFTMSHIVPKKYAKQALLHDATEAFMGDIPSPLKQLLPDYKEIEKRVESAIFKKFGFDRLHPSIKKADLVMLATERRDLMPEGGEVEWKMIDGVPPLEEKITPYSNQSAKAWFIRRYKQLP